MLEKFLIQPLSYFKGFFEFVVKYPVECIVPMGIDGRTCILFAAFKLKQFELVSYNLDKIIISCKVGKADPATFVNFSLAFVPGWNKKLGITHDTEPYDKLKIKEEKKRAKLLKKSMIAVSTEWKKVREGKLFHWHHNPISSG